MSNEYKDWEQDRKNEVWQAIIEICTIYDGDNDLEKCGSMVLDVLVNYGFI